MNLASVDAGHLFAALPDSHILCVPPQQIHLPNPAFLRLSEYSAAELQGRSLSELFDQVGRETLRYGLECLRHQAHFGGGGDLLTRGGAAVPVSIQLRRIPEYAPADLLVRLYDESAQQQVETRLRQHEHWVSQVLDAVSDGVWDWDARTGEVYRSSGWLRMFNYERHGNNVAAWTDLIHPDDLPRVMRRFNAHLNGHAALYQCEYRMKTGAGEWKWTLDRGRAVERDEQGRVLRMIGAHQDIDVRKHAELELERYHDHLEELVRQRTAELAVAKDAAEAANQAKSAFLANISHELRTPLNAVLGFAQILSRDPELAEVHHESVRSIYRGGEYLLTLINDILDLAKIEAGHFELFPRAWDTEDFFQEIGHMFHIHARQKSLEFHYETPEPLPAALYCDDKRLRQIIVNLLGNAVKFTEHGSVALRVSYAQRSLRLEVVDTGLGIPPEELDKIFEPFQQCGSRHYNVQGSGLGLAITRRLVEAMGGRLGVSSRLGGGSHFYAEVSAEAVSSPRPKTPAGEPAIVGYLNRRDALPLRLLVTDDVADNRRVLRGFLEPLGFSVEEAVDGADCLRHLPRFRPDLVLMDLRMPGLDGLETTRRLRAQAEFSQLPVVMVSASTFAEDCQRSLEAGCNAHLAKPLQFDLLLETLGQWLPLEWVQAQPNACADPLASLPLLAQQHADEFMRLVRTGDIMGLSQFAEVLEQLGYCQDFTRQLKRLARDFNISEILRLAEALQKRLDQRF